MIEDIVSSDAWLIHQYPVRDHLYLLYFITPHQWIKGFYRVSKRKKSSVKPQLFSPYWISWHKQQIRHIESRGIALELKGLKLFMGLYLNELTFYCCRHGDVVPRFYALYEQLLYDARECHELLLRLYEWQLLTDCGYGLDFSVTADHQPIQSQLHYGFHPKLGFSQTATGIAGADLLAIHQHDFSAQAYRVLKNILRMVIDDVLDGQTLHSRQLLRQWLQKLVVTGNTHNFADGG